MLTTINISLPKSLYADARKKVSQRGYASISELIRDSLRRHLYEEEITINGFTKAFEDHVLEAEKEPEENDVVLETKQDIDKFFDSLN